MFWIDLTRAETEPLSFRETLELPPGSGGEDVVESGPLTFEGGVEHAGRGFLLHATVEGKARLRCGRCLTEFDFPFAEEVALRLLPIVAAPQDDETRLGRNDLDTRFYDEPRADLVELAAEQFALAVPMKPLCTADCRGLCPHCGANLNLGPCPCPQDEPDARFAPLLDWRPSE